MNTAVLTRGLLAGAQTLATGVGPLTATPAAALPGRPTAVATTTARPTVVRPTAAATRATPSDCALVADGRVRGLRGRPGRVTTALATGYGRSTVRVTHCVRRGTGYVAAWQRTGRIGRHGYARPGVKREGDGRSPSGVFALGRRSAPPTPVPA